MRLDRKNKIIINAILLALILIVGYLFYGNGSNDVVPSDTVSAVTTNAATTVATTTAATTTETTTAAVTVVDIETETSASQAETAETTISLSEDGSYTTKEDVALYIHLYGKLPSNYITKDDAKALGWDSSKGNLWDVAPGMSIGGDKFGNYEELLPVEKGKKYYECDIDYEGGYRGAERIIYSNDGFIYFTEDHYATFELLYEGE